MQIKLKRVYDKSEAADGLRILVERLWPRGLSKKDAKVDMWPKDLAPSTELRKWFDHDPDKWKEFRKRYFEELGKQKEAVAELIKVVRGKSVTFVYASKEEKYNNSQALKEYLERRVKSRPAD